MGSLYNYDPLSDIIFHDDFDRGLCGWVVLSPNLRQDVIDYFPSQQRYSDWGPPMLSSATFGYVGTHGSMSGTYSLKIGTRPQAGKASEQPIKGSIGHAIKRLTYLKRQLLRCEMWYTFKAEQDRPGIGRERHPGFRLHVGRAGRRGPLVLRRPLHERRRRQDAAAVADPQGQPGHATKTGATWARAPRART